MEHDLLKETLLLERELNDLKENLSLVEIKMEKDDNIEMEPKSIQNGDDIEIDGKMDDHPEDGHDVGMDLKKVEPTDFIGAPSLVDTTKNGRSRKKMEIESSDDERVEYNHKFPNINPRCCTSFIELCFF